MKGLKYESILTYNYSKTFEEMERILEIDNFNCFKLDDDLKIVEYFIDHSKQIQLSLLLYLQDIKLIRFTIAQQIQLCLNIYQKYNFLLQSNIQHNYLSTDRIWLNVINNNQITILPKYLQYTIHFVGFDCPFYELDNYQNSNRNNKQTINDIIINIMEQLKKTLLMKSKSQEKKQILQNIFKSLLDQGIYKSFEDFHQQSIQFFQKYNNQSQRLNEVVIDKELTYYNSKRARRIDDVIENIQLIIQAHYKDGQFYQFQHILYQIFPIIAKELKTATFYENQKLTKIQQQQDLDSYIYKIDNQEVNKMINENKELIMKDFKFEIDMQQIIESINEELFNQLKFLKYFLNNVNFANKNNILMQIDQFKKQKTQKLIIQKLKDYLELEILKLIEQLI